jgi:hypothetical protein
MTDKDTLRMQRRITAAVKKAVRNEIAERLRLGYPVVYWEKGVGIKTIRGKRWKRRRL